MMPFLTEHLWQILVRDVDGKPPPSVHLAGWPDAPLPDENLLAEVAEVRRVVGLGHQVRAASRLKLRQPLRRLVVEGAPLAAGACRRVAGGVARQGGRVRPGRGDASCT